MSIIIPATVGNKTVTGLNNWCFSDCTSLETVTFSKNSNFTTIGGNAFANCTSLASISIPNSVNSIGSFAFKGCSSLTSVNIPDKVTTIDTETFSNCSKLTNINIPDSVTNIKPGVFLGCSSLTSITIPNRVTSIGNGAFKNCTALTAISIPNSVTHIWYDAFAGCSLLTSITIPNSVTQIEEGAFNLNSTNNVNVQIRQDIDHADEKSCDALKNEYKTKLTEAGLTNPTTYTTWFDSNTNSPSETFDVFNLNTTSTTTIASGFKAWKDEKSTNRSITLKYTTSDNSISATGTLDDNLSTITTTITGNIPNIEAKDVTFTPQLRLRDDSSNVLDKVINLQSGTIHLSANDSFAPSGPVFSKNENLPATRLDGLWALKDSYVVTAEINKAYFNNDWNNQQNIITNLNKYFKFINGAGNELTLNSLGNWKWFNSEIGIVEFSVEWTTSATFNFLFKIYKGSDDNQTDYKDQTINCFLRTKTDNNQVFAVQTFNKYKFKPEFYFNGQTPEPVQLSLDNLTQNVVFGLGVQSEDSQLAKNAFEWYLKNGYSLSVDTSSFSDDNISVGNNISINDDFTRLSFPINLTTPNINEKTLNINNLSVLAYKEGMPDTRIALPQFSVSLSTNNNFNETHQFNKNTVINNNRDGLWIPGDIFQTNLTINKAYFGTHYNDKEYIKTHFDEFINVEGKSTYTFNHNQGTNIYTHPQIGQLEIANIEENNHNWQITLNFSLPESDQYKLLTQSINFIPKLDPTKGTIFTLLTKSIDEYDPNWNGLEANNLTLPFNEQNGTVIWNDTDQNKVKALGNTNTCKWAVSKGYRLEISDFTNEFISLDQQATFDVKANQLEVNFKKLKQIVENQNVNLSGLKLLIKDGNNVIKEIIIPDLVITLSVQHYWVILLTSIFSTILVVGLCATFGVYLKEKRTKKVK